MEYLAYSFLVNPSTARTQRNIRRPGLPAYLCSENIEKGKKKIMLTNIGVLICLDVSLSLQTSFICDLFMRFKILSNGFSYCSVSNGQLQCTLFDYVDLFLHTSMSI